MDISSRIQGIRLLIVAIEEGVRDSNFEAYYRPGIQDSNFKQVGIQDSKLINQFGGNVQSKNTQDSGFKFETGLDSRFKFESQKNARDSGFRFGLQGPYLMNVSIHNGQLDEHQFISFQSKIHTFPDLKAYLPD